MKCLGILGGMSWESTAHYYQLINEGVKARLGGLHSADLLVRSVDFALIERWQQQGDWHSAAAYLAHAAQLLKAGGAEGLVIATNTMHKVADDIIQASGLELIHIADCTGAVLQAEGRQKVALLGTAFTMEQSFYKQRLIDHFDLEVIVPDRAQRDDVHRIIYQELCLGQINPASRQRYQEIVADLADRGAQSVILGCTEIGMLIGPEDTPVALIDTTLIHAQSAVEWLLAEQ
ncbi:MAG: aspartate/glutamate racemase family protein [Reinekea forsetii]|jgi:aspartate racemase|nr:aspartate/glutamate racemase family protein [Reinekea forsetii]